MFSFRITPLYAPFAWKTSTPLFAPVWFSGVRGWEGDIFTFNKFHRLCRLQLLQSTQPLLLFSSSSFLSVSAVIPRKSKLIPHTWGQSVLFFETRYHTTFGEYPWSIHGSRILIISRPKTSSCLFKVSPVDCASVFSLLSSDPLRWSHTSGSLLTIDTWFLLALTSRIFRDSLLYHPLELTCWSTL